MYKIKNILNNLNHKNSYWFMYSYYSYIMLYKYKNSIYIYIYIYKPQRIFCGIFGLIKKFRFFI